MRTLMDWLVRLLMTEPLEGPSTEANHDDLDAMREHIDTLERAVSPMEQRLIAIERRQQHGDGWVTDPPPEKD